MVNTTATGRQQRDQHGDQRGDDFFHAATTNRFLLADPNGTRLQERAQFGGDQSTQCSSALRGGRTSLSARTAQSSMGGIADGIAAWLDRTRWPTLPGTSQASWEEPRVSTLASPFRTKRLKALGNAIVPQQIYPLLAWIVAYERSVAMEGEEEQQQQEKQQQEAEETG